MRPLAPLAAIAVLAAPAALAARPVELAIPPGTAAEAAIAIARATNASIVIADPALGRRRIAAIKGRMDAASAVKKLARASGMQAVKVGPDAWRLVAAPQRTAKAGRQRPAAETARAQAAVPQPLPEAEGPPIIVTASKRDLTFTEVPAQVTLLDGELLARGGVGGTEKIMQRSAAVSSTYLGSGRNKLFIRGIADSSFTGPTQATVGQYFGDLRLSYNAPDPDLRLSDMERVEILEGPQGTLYGAGSLGGIIRLVPRAPEPGETSLVVSGGAALIAGGEPGGDANATINLPLVGETATLRLNIDAATLGGYIDKPGLGRSNVNRTQILAGRAALRVDLAPDWSADVILLGQDTEAEDSQYADREGRRLESSARVTEGSRAQYGQAQLVVNGAIGGIRIKSSTGIGAQDLTERYDATAPGGAPRVFRQRNETRMIANETRIWQPAEPGRALGWVLGSSIIDNRNSLTRGIGPAGEPETASTGVENTVFEITGYGEASYRLLPVLTLAAGLRVTSVELGGEGENVPLPIAIANRAVTATRRQTAWLPSASALVDVGADGRAWLRYQEGFRPGGLAVSGDFVRQFKSDRARTVELGGGWGVPGRGDFDVSASLSYTRWRDIQADFIDEGGLPSTANVGDGTILAASVTGSVRLAPGLRFDAGATINDSRVDVPQFFALTPLSLTGFDIVPPRGAESAARVLAAPRLGRIPNIAQVSGRAGLQWRRDFGNGTALLADGWISYVGKSRLGVGPELGELQGDYLDSGLIVRFGRDNAGLTLTLSNLFESQGNRFALGTPFSTGRAQVTPLQPRTIRIGFDTRF
ncbi:TonB-dependent receptor [Porphyrobacter sp. YT40]|uniref:TonB-dependent receptor n=1 Tax=Porphyrobacter sp. YT40 TaxID=2547601 RepID=UPI0011439014|nr:TonB-dependent receptor [Porphyrobacter sp. YT40]QDH35738.1 TonB-dependent receptor [Porphyrobacter sp. YT40]